MADKPLSDKKIRRMLRKEQKKDQLLLNKLPQEWQNPPKNLKGKAIGLWHREKARRLKLLQEAKSSIEEQKVLTKKQKKALQLNLCTSTIQSNSLSKKEAKIAGQSCQIYKMKFDASKKEMIKNYFASLTETPLFLSPEEEYHKKIMKALQQSEQKPTPCDIEIDIDSNDVFALQKQTTETLDLKSDQEITFSHIKEFFTGEKSNTNDSSQCCKQVCDSVSEENGMYTNESTDLLDSMDKYKTLEDTPFKRSFLEILSTTIETRLEKSVQCRSVLQKNQRLDRTFYDQLVTKENKPSYKKMLRVRQTLPAFKMRNEIVDLINSNQVVLISGETGCGKTTQVAQFILDDAILSMNGSLCNILCTQPRRISAVSVAQRVSCERNEIVGRESVGYHIRLENKPNRGRGAIMFCTTGILLQYMQSGPALKRYSHIILDEIHERDILCDFVLTILKDVIIKRTDLKIILMSATLNAEQFSKYFNDCATINIPGSTFPVQELYLEDVLLETKFSFDKVSKKRNRDSEEDESFKTHVLPYVEQLRKEGKYPNYVLEGLRNPESERAHPELIIELMRHICSSNMPGAILVFVSGMEDINGIMRKMTEEFFPPSQFVIIPLHSMLPTNTQQIVFDRPPHGKRKIVIATNIAETSITIDDVVFVIDCGKIKIKNYDVRKNISTLKPEFVSLANARQRRGRAGRVQSGICYHMFSRGRESVLMDYPLPEMVRTRLDVVILNIKLLQLGKAASFLRKVMNPPDPRTVETAFELLHHMAALDEQENLTPLGYHLAKLPLDPQIGKMLLMGVVMSCLDPILSIAATLSHKDPFYVPLGEERTLKERKLEFDNGHKSDHLIMAKVIKTWEEEEKQGKGRDFCNRNFLTRTTLFGLRDLKLQFTNYLQEMGFIDTNKYKSEKFNVNSENIALIKAVICSGLYPNVAIIKRKIDTKSRGLVLLRTYEDGNVSLHPKSVNTIQQNEFESTFLVYHEKLKSSCIFIYDSTMVSSLPLVFFCQNYLKTTEGKSTILRLNDALVFRCDKETANLIEALKIRLHGLLEYRLSHPAGSSKKDEIGLLGILTELFTDENDDMMLKQDSSD